MNRIIIIGALLLSVQSILCQADSFGDWLVSLNTGLEAHDKRLFNYSARGMLLDMQPDFFGTYHVGLGVHRKYLQKNRLNGYIGFGASYEYATFIRPFNHLQFPGDSVKILYHLDNYQKYHVNLSFLVLHDLGSEWILSGEITKNFVVYRNLGNPHIKYSEATFEMDNIELRLGVIRRIDSFFIGINSRLVNFQKIDRNIFDEVIVKDPRINKKWEWHNPLRFDLTVGYSW